MADNSFKIKNSVVLTPKDLTTLPNPEAGDLACDINDANKIKRYNTLSSSWQELGSGSSGINYLAANSDFEAGTTGYSTYADAAAAVPVDGTGGTANITFTATTVSPLRGTRSGLITKDAANRQGQGVSYNFNIDLADQAQVLRFSFDYQTSANYADGDVRIYIYDVTNNQIVEVINRDLPANNFGKFVGSFQTNSTSTSYRAIWHIASSNAASYTVEIDNVIIGPQAITKGAIVTDWQSFTPTGSWTGTYSGKYRRVGDSAEIQYMLTVSSASGTLTLNPPSGLAFDGSKIDNLIIGSQGELRDINVGVYPVINAYYNGTGLFLTTIGTSSASNHNDTLVTATAPFTWANGDIVRITVKVPILGWSSNMVLSEDFGNREVYVYANATTQSIPDNSITTILFQKLNDTTNSYNNSTGVFTVPETGTYLIDVMCQLSAGTGVDVAGELFLYSGSTIINSYSTARPMRTYSIESYNDRVGFQLHQSRYLIKGTQITVRINQVSSDGLAKNIIASNSATNLCISKLASPQTIVGTVGVAEELHSSNVLINGSFDYWQRGTSFTNVGVQYTADRWKYFKNISTAAQTVSRSTDVPPNSPNQYSLLSTVTTADTGFTGDEYIFIEHNIEGNFFRPLKNKKCVLTFWVKSSVVGNYSIALRNLSASRSLIKNYQINQANVWEKKVIRFQHDSSGSWDYTTGSGLRLTYVLANGTTFASSTEGQWLSGNFVSVNQVNSVATIGNTFQLADVMLVEDNEGQTRDPEFQLAGRDLAEELQLCQRYFTKTFPLDVAPAQNSFAIGSLEVISQAAGAAIWYPWHYPVPMRVSPNVVTYCPNANSANWTANPSTPIASFGESDNRRVTIRGTNSTALSNAYSIHASADAEL